MRKIERLRQKMETKNRVRKWQQPDELWKAVIVGSSEPFQSLLTDLLGAAPTPLALRAYAQANPDKWMKMVDMARKSAGYSDTIKTETDITVKVGRMSDLELLKEIKKLEQAPEVIDITPEVSETT